MVQRKMEKTISRLSTISVSSRMTCFSFFDLPYFRPRHEPIRRDSIRRIEWKTGALLFISLPRSAVFTEFIQNGLAGFGKGRIIKGSHFVNHNLETIKETFDRLVKLTTEEHQPMIMLEHLSLKKVLSVPNGTAAFCRKHAYNMIIFVTWSNNTTENLATARQITRELNETFVAGQVKELGHTNHGYANFGMRSNLFKGFY